MAALKYEVLRVEAEGAGGVARARVVQFSGVHGVGKTELIARLAELHSDWVPLNEFSSPKPPYPFGTPGERGFINEVWVLRQLLERNKWRPPIEAEVVLADRGFEDALVYSRVLLDDQLFKLFEDVWRSLYELYQYKPALIILLDAPVDIILKRIRSRGRPTMKEWREDDEGYVASLKERFLELVAPLKEVEVVKADSLDDEIKAVERILVERGIIP